MTLRRSDAKCPIFGSGSEVPKNVLPTYEDVIKLFIYEQNKRIPNKLVDSVKEISEIVSSKLEEVWRRASIPFVEHRTVLARIKTYHDKYKNLLKPYKTRKDVASYIDRVSKFKSESKKLFDIATCKCASFDLCSCDKHRKIPVKGRVFLSDQRSGRKMILGSLDRESTRKNKINIEKKLRQTAHKQSMISSKPADKSSKIYHDCRARIRSVSPLGNQDTTLTASSTSKVSVVADSSTSAFPAVARILDRYGVSDRAGAAIVSATLQDIGVITQNDTSKVIDRSKIRRLRSKARSKLTNMPLRFDNEIIAIFFDGRKDKTLISDDNRRKIISEEHISLLKEPDSQYMGHISVGSSDANNISRKIYSFLICKQINLKNILAIGCDGTAVNTGSKGGVIRLLESKLQKPLQWLVCQLHGNELPLRHLFNHIDGSTTGPNSFNGHIGKKLHKCEFLPLVKFNIIECLLPIITKSKQDLSTDQLYLLEICQAINCGICDQNLPKRNPGKMCHSRWVTTANRILRLYVSTEAPSNNLLTIVHFILKVYAPMWFKIKTQPLAIHGAKHLFVTIKLSRYLPNNLKAIIDPVIQRNGYFGHSENILIAMLADNRKHIRELALCRIIKVRQTTSGLAPKRVFKMPTLNFSAEDYINLIDWKSITEPPLTKRVHLQILQEIIHNSEMMETEILQDFKQMPCHTQATERCIKLVSEACAAVCGPERRDGYIKNKIKAHQMMPTFNTKKEYRPQ